MASSVGAFEALIDPVDGFLESTIYKFEIALLYNNPPDCGCDEKDSGYQVRGTIFCGMVKRFLLSVGATWVPKFYPFDRPKEAYGVERYG